MARMWLGASVVLAILLVGLLRGSAGDPANLFGLHADTRMASATGSCGEIVSVQGASGSRSETLHVYTNALVYIPACPVERLLWLTGTTVGGVGPAVTVAGADGSSRWAGNISPSLGSAVALSSGESTWVSFTNDAVRGSEDRNLTLQLVAP